MRYESNTATYLNQLDRIIHSCGQQGIRQDNHLFIRVSTVLPLEQNKKQLAVLTEFTEKLKLNKIPFTCVTEWSEKKANGYHLHLLTQRQHQHTISTYLNRLLVHHESNKTHLALIYAQRYIAKIDPTKVITHTPVQLRLFDQHTVTEVTEKKEEKNINKPQVYTFPLYLFIKNRMKSNIKNLGFIYTDTVELVNDT